jgi:hypothetical protein
MTIISPTHGQDHYVVSRSFPGGYAKPEHLDHNFIVVGLFSLLGVALTAAALCSGATPDISDIAAFLG